MTNRFFSREFRRESKFEINAEKKIFPVEVHEANIITLLAFLTAEQKEEKHLFDLTSQYNLADNFVAFVRLAQQKASY